jgi:intracellular sulfur oxidation DsrE/DsrF family protein
MSSHTVNRRGFIGSLAATTALGAAALTLPPAVQAQGKGKPGKTTDAKFDAWLGRIKGKHRQVFDAPMPNGGFPLAWARVFLMTNKQVGVAENDMTAVIVLRHDAIPIGMENNLWEKYAFGENFHINDADNKPLMRNSFAFPNPGEHPLPDMNLPDLVKSGVVIGICDMALTVYSGMLGKKMNMDAAEIKKDWVAGILPGVEIVPSGVLAVNRAQEYGCTYCFAG